MMDKTTQFETERLFIKPTTIEDASLIYELLNMPKWIKYIGKRDVNSIADAENYIKEKMLPQFEKLGYSNNTVIRKSDNKKIGTCGLYSRDGIDGVDIGFAFLPQYEKKGYAFESANKLIEIAKTDYEIAKISAITTEENTASQKLIEKLGLTFTKMITIPNDDATLMLFEVEL